MKKTYRICLVAPQRGRQEKTEESLRNKILRFLWEESDIEIPQGEEVIKIDREGVFLARQRYNQTYAQR